MTDKNYLLIMSIIGVLIISLSLYVMLQTYRYRYLGMMFFIPSFILNMVALVFGGMLLVPVVGMIGDKEWQ